MRFNIKLATVLTVALVNLGAAVPVSAATIYSQLFTQSTVIPFFEDNSTVTPHSLIGDFSVDQNMSIASGTGSSFFQFRSTALSYTVYFMISTDPTNPPSSEVCESNRSLTFNPTSDFQNVSSITFPIAGQTCVLTAGTTYYVHLRSSTGGATGELPGGTGPIFYGYLNTTGGGLSTIDAGLVGYTDYGLSTTSQQAYCDSNLATSTGLLDSIGASFSRGICNVSTFLFIPSTVALSNFSSLASTTRTRIPISYFFDIYGDYLALSATTTDAVPTYTADLHGVGIGSTTPLGNILPTLTVLSKGTIDTYLPPGIHDALFLLARSIIWIGVAMVLYRAGKRLFVQHPHHLS